MVLDPNAIKSDPANSKNVRNLLKPDGLGGEKEWIVPLVELEQVRVQLQARPVHCCEASLPRSLLLIYTRECIVIQNYRFSS